MKIKKERHEVKFRIQLYMLDGAFLQKQLKAKNFIVDIRPSSIYPSDKQNKYFSFQIKTTLTATTLSIGTCST